MKTSRQRLLNFIETHQAVTASEICRSLNMTQSNARYHLAILENQGLVEMIGLHAKKGKGRPTRIFSIPAHFKGDNLDRLLDIMLREFITSSGNQNDDLLRKLARQLAGITDNNQIKVMTAQKEKTIGITIQKLSAVIQRLNELNYHAHWEAHCDAPRIIFGNCPYAAILNDHPELCRMDTFLLMELLGVQVDLQISMIRNERGLPHCVFSIPIF